MKSKKICNMLSPMAGILSFMIINGAAMPVLAAENEKAAVYSQQTQKKGQDIIKSVEINGVKISIYDLKVSKNEIKVKVKIQTKNKITDEDLVTNNIVVQQTYGNKQNNGCSGSIGCVDDKTIECECDDNFDEDIEAKGTLRIDVVVPYYDINETIKIPVDFTDEFAKIKETKINKHISELNIDLDKIVTSSFGTDVYYSKPVDNNEDNSNSWDLDDGLLFKYGDKIYTSDQSSCGGDDSRETGYYRCEVMKSDNMTADETISVIPCLSDITFDEAREIWGNAEENIKTETKDNVQYVSDFKFNDGSKGEIYKIEKEDGKIKIYCKGSTEKDSLLLAKNLSVDYDYSDDEMINSDDFYMQSENSFIYKDKDDEKGYVVQCDNINTKKKINVTIYNIAKFNDRFKIYDEVKIK